MKRDAALLKVVVFLVLVLTLETILLPLKVYESCRLMNMVLGVVLGMTAKYLDGVKIL